MAESHLRVAIIGAGIGGLSLGLALQERGIQADVFEQAPELDRDRGRHRAVRQLHPRVRAARSDGRAGRRLHHPHRADLPALAGRKPYRRPPGPRGQLVREAVRRPVLRHSPGRSAEDAQRRVRPEHLHLGCRLVNIVQERDSVVLEFANGRVERADLVVGADGVRSTVRRFVTGADDAVYSGTSAFRGIVPVENLPSLPDPHAIQFWMGPDAHMLHYAIGGNGESVNFFAVVETPKIWLHPGTVADVHEEVPVASFRGWHPAITEMIKAAASPISWALFTVRPLLQWHRDRVVILGDAAHGMLPHHGQGANTSDRRRLRARGAARRREATTSTAPSPDSRPCGAPAPARSSGAPRSPVRCCTCPTVRRRKPATRRWPGCRRTSGGSTSTTSSRNCRRSVAHPRRPRPAPTRERPETTMDRTHSLTDITTVLASAAGINPADVTPDMSIAGDLGHRLHDDARGHRRPRRPVRPAHPRRRMVAIRHRRRPRRAPSAGRRRRGSINSTELNGSRSNGPTSPVPSKPGPAGADDARAGPRPGRGHELPRHPGGLAGEAKRIAGARLQTNVRRRTRSVHRTRRASHSSHPEEVIVDAETNAVVATRRPTATPRRSSRCWRARRPYVSRRRSPRSPAWSSPSASRRYCRDPDRGLVLVAVRDRRHVARPGRRRPGPVGGDPGPVGGGPRLAFRLRRRQGGAPGGR